MKKETFTATLHILALFGVLVAPWVFGLVALLRSFGWWAAVPLFVCIVVCAIGVASTEVPSGEDDECPEDES